MDKKEIAGIIMSSLFVAGEAVEVDVFAEITGQDGFVIDEVVRELEAELCKQQSGILIKRIESKIQLCTNARYANYIKTLFAPPINEALTNSMLETLSIIAYRQPVTRSEISDIRGVQSNYAVSALFERGLIREAGRKDVLGRPALLATTEEFLRHFGISSLEELPQLELELEVQDEVDIIGAEEMMETEPLV